MPTTVKQCASKTLSVKKEFFLRILTFELTQGLKHAYLTDSRVIFHGGLLKSELKSNAALNIQQLN